MTVPLRTILFALLFVGSAGGALYATLVGVLGHTVHCVIWLERAMPRAFAGELAIGSEAVGLGAMPHERIWNRITVADSFIITNDITNRCNPLCEAICLCGRAGDLSARA